MGKGHFVTSRQQGKLYCSLFTLSVKYKLFKSPVLKYRLQLERLFFIERDNASLDCGIRIRKTTVLFYKNLGSPKASWLTPVYLYIYTFLYSSEMFILFKKFLRTKQCTISETSMLLCFKWCLILLYSKHREIQVNKNPRRAIFHPQ